MYRQSIDSGAPRNDAVDRIEIQRGSRRSTDLRTVPADAEPSAGLQQRGEDASVIARQEGEAMADKVTVEREGQVLLIGVNRPEKRNAWDLDIIRGVAEAFTRLSDDAELRAGVIFGHGDHFTAGLDLPAVAPLVAQGRFGDILPSELRDPWGLGGEPCAKPVVVAVHGRCLTLGIELILNAQTCIAAENTVFGQLEVARGIVPLGGATFRLPLMLGGNGMRYLLTAEEFSAAEALRIGLVQEVVPLGRQLDRALEIARLIAIRAPLGVQAALANARAAVRPARDAAAAHLREVLPAIFASADALEAVMAMTEKREPRFTGR
jgi:enoyl-CoA hydratase